MRDELESSMPHWPVVAELERAAHQLLAFTAGLEGLEVVGLYLAVASAQLGLGVEEIDLARAANLHQQDDRAGTRRKVAGTGTKVHAR